MNKNKQFMRIAKEFGIKQPEVQYERRHYGYSIRITVPNPNPRQPGFIDPAVKENQNTVSNSTVL
jgi:hypothetical protein